MMMYALHSLSSITPEDMRDVAAVLTAAGELGGGLLNKVIRLSHTGKDTGVGQAISDYCQVRPFAFHGDHMDLSVFWNYSSLPLTEIARLEEPLNDAVMENFKDMEKTGLVEQKEGAFIPTEKGRLKMYDPELIKSVVKREKDGIAAVKQGVEKIAGKSIGKSAGAAAETVSTGGIALAAQALQETVKTGARSVGTAVKKI